MTRTLAVAVLLAACSTQHEVRLLLGPNETSLTIGMRCYRDNPPDELMFQRAVGAGVASFALVIDIITIEGTYPGCRGEELIQKCLGTGECELYTERGRYCQDLVIPLAELNFNDGTSLRRKLEDALREKQPVIAEDVPDLPVIIRAIATMQSCAQISASPQAPLLAVDLVLGCAYSCPARLDDVEGSITLSLDTLTQQCEQAVRYCAAFPGLPPP